MFQGMEREKRGQKKGNEKKGPPTCNPKTCSRYRGGNLETERGKKKAEGTGEDGSIYCFFKRGHFTTGGKEVVSGGKKGPKRREGGT